MAYTNFIDLEIGGIGAAMDAVATARGRLRATENDFTRAFEAMEASRDQKLVDKANSLDGDKAALDKANASADPKLVKALAEREAALKAANTAAQAADRKLEKIQREQQQDANRKIGRAHDGTQVHKSNLVC